MNEPKPPEIPAKPPSIAVQVTILIVCGFFLSAGSCAGFLTSGFGNKSSANLFSMGFFAGLLLMVGAVVWAIVRVATRN